MIDDINGEYKRSSSTNTKFKKNPHMQLTSCLQLFSWHFMMTTQLSKFENTRLIKRTRNEATYGLLV